MVFKLQEKQEDKKSEEEEQDKDADKKNEEEEKDKEEEKSDEREEKKDEGEKEEKKDEPKVSFVNFFKNSQNTQKHLARTFRRPC